MQLGSYTLSVGDATSTAFAGSISGTGGITKLGDGVLTLSGLNTFTGELTVQAGVLQLGNATIFGSVDANIINNAALVFNRSNDITYSGSISGSGSLEQAGSATLTLSGANSYTGLTTITTGTLALAGGDALQDAAAVVLSANAGVTLKLNASETIGSLAGGADGSVDLGPYRLTLGDVNSTLIAASITGSGGFTKRGTGTVTLTGVNTFEDRVAIEAGTLTLGNATAIRPSTVVQIFNEATASLNLGATLTVGRLTGVELSVALFH